jgi:hypothetical protein
MQSTVPEAIRRTSVPWQIAPSLAAAFARVPDPRRVVRVVYPPAAIRTKQLAELAITQWDARPPAERLRALGFTNGRTPSSTLQNSRSGAPGLLVQGGDEHDRGPRFLPPQDPPGRRQVHPGQVPPPAAHRPGEQPDERHGDDRLRDGHQTAENRTGERCNARPSER